MSVEHTLNTLAKIYRTEDYAVIFDAQTAEVILVHPSNGLRHAVALIYSLPKHLGFNRDSDNDVGEVLTHFLASLAGPDVPADTVSTTTITTTKNHLEQAEQQLSAVTEAYLANHGNHVLASKSLAGLLLSLANKYATPLMQQPRKED